MNTGGDLLHDFRGATHDYILAELERRKTELKTQLVWVGAQKEPGITARTWKWVNGMHTFNLKVIFEINSFEYKYPFIQVKPLLNQHGVRINQTIIMANRIVLCSMVDETGCGMMSAAI